MARWDPGTEERLRAAALELFKEHGYDNVTVTQIAERAGITRRTYFRYFPDKREVLFGGAERLPPAIGTAVRDADPGLPPLAAALAALTEVGTLLATDYGAGVADRRAVIDATPELQERERTKGAAILVAVEQALRERGATGDDATAAAQVATLAFANAWERFARAERQRTFAECLDAAVTALRAVVCDHR